MRGDKGSMGICLESAKGQKGEPGPIGDICNTGEVEGRNETYIGPPGQKGPEGPRVSRIHRSIAHR